MNGALAAHGLVASRAGLDFHIRAGLSGRTQLSSRDVVDELGALAEVRHAVQLERGYVGGDNVPELIERRIMRTLSLGGIGEKLRQLPNKVEEIKTLLDIHDVLSGALNKRLVCDYIDYVVEDRELGTKVAELGDGEGVRALGQMYALIEAGGIAEAQKTHLCTVLLETQSNFLRERRFFANLDKEHPTTVARSLYLMDLCAARGFIPGYNLEAARQLIVRLILKDDFLPSYLKDAADVMARENKINQLKSNLLEAGIDEAVI